MDEHQWLAEQFEANRAHLQSVAYRMLGSLPEANDAVQEAWLRLSRSDTLGVENLGGWLTTVVARICLDMLRSRKARREEALDASAPERIATHEDGSDPEQQALLADSVSLALLVILDTLGPAERLAFVLHDMFDMPFEEIAPIVGRSETAVRQLASRARRRVKGGAAAKEPDLAEQRKVVNAFLTASREGSFDALLAVLDPDVVLRLDRAAAAAAPGMPSEIRGAPPIAKQFVGRAQGARPVLVNGSIGAAVARQGRLFLVLRFAVKHGKIVEIEAVADQARLGRLHLSVLDDGV